MLLLALDEYFKNPHPATLASLYEAVNTMDLSLMPKLSLLERYLLQASDNKDLFVEKFEQMIQMRMAEDRGEAPDTIANMGGSPERRGNLLRNGTKAHVQAQSTYSIPRDTHEFETRVTYNGIPIPIKVPARMGPKNLQVVSRAVASNNIDADFCVRGRSVVGLASLKGRGDDFIWSYYNKNKRECIGVIS